MTSSIRYVLRPATARRVGAQARVAGTLRHLSPLSRSGPYNLYSTATSPASKPFQLYTAGTPNGRKVSILLEELRDQYGLKYQYVGSTGMPRCRRLTRRRESVHPIDIGKGTQKEPWFIRMNPNGRIPVLVDSNRDNFTVFETAAILLYLEQHYDTQLKFSFDPRTRPNEYSEMLQWIFFTVRNSPLCPPP